MNRKSLPILIVLKFQVKQRIYNHMKIYKMIIGFLGVLAIINPTFSALEQYLNYSFSSGKTIILGLLLVIILLLLVYKRGVRKTDIGYFGYSYIIFIIMLFTSVIFTDINISHYPGEFFSRVIYPFIIMINFYLVIKYLDFKKFIRISFFVNLFASVFVLFIHVIGNLSGRTLNVLGVSDRLAFLGILMFCIEKRPINKLIILITTFVTLLMYSSFTTVIIFSFAVFIMLTYILYVNGSTNRKRVIIFGLIFSLFIILSILLVIKDQNIILTGETYFTEKANYILRRLHNVLNQRDSSQVARQKLLEEGIIIIKNKPFTGEFLYEVKVIGSTGGYIHNWFSYIAEFGISVFLLLFVQYIRYMYKNYKIFIDYNDKNSFALFFSSIYVLMVCMVSRSYSHVFIWISLAMLMAYSYKKKIT